MKLSIFILNKINVHLNITLNYLHADVIQYKYWNVCKKNNLNVSSLQVCWHINANHFQEDSRELKAFCSLKLFKTDDRQNLQAWRISDTIVSPTIIQAPTEPSALSTHPHTPPPTDITLS